VKALLDKYIHNGSRMYHNEGFT